jgi:gas vesicle protein
VLASTSELTKAQAKAVQNSVIVKEFKKAQDKQATRLQSLRADLEGWQIRVNQPDAFAQNHSAKDLIHLSASAAIDLLLENRRNLTQAHRESLSQLGVSVHEVDEQSSLLFRADLQGTYPDQSVNALLGDEAEDGFTAMEIWEVMYRLNLTLVQKSDGVTQEYTEAKRNWEDERKEHNKALQAVRETSEKAKKTLQSDIQRLEEEFGNHKDVSVSFIVSASCHF